MRGWSRRRPARSGWVWVSPALIALVVATLVAPTASVTASSLGAATTVVTPDATGAISATVLWNHQNAAKYDTASSAATIAFNAAVDVRFFWNSTSGPAGAPGLITISDARLQIFYFGFSLVTRDVFESPPAPALSGSYDMSWSTGSLQYILEGTYRLVASLLTPNGTTEWSQTFWVIEAAPFYVLALLPIVLLVIGIWELYSIATVGRQAALGRPPPTTGGGASSAPAPTSPAATPPTEETPPAAPEETPPPADGGSS
jgi:hypothetical protein